MSERSIFPNIRETVVPLPNEVLASRFANFMDGLDRFILSPPTSSSPDNVSYYRAYGNALRKILVNSDDPDHVAVKSTVDYLVKARPEMPPDQQVTHYQQAIFYVNYSYLPDVQPRDSETPWRELITRTVHDEEKLYQMRMAFDLFLNQTNVPQRYSGVLMGLIIAKSGQVIDAADMGASAGLGDIQLLNKIPFDPFEIEADEYHSQKILYAVHEGIDFRKIVGYDKFPQPNPLYVEACSTQMSEIGDSQRIEQRQRLHELIRDQNFHVLFGDMVNWDPPEQPTTPDGKFDAVFALTSMYEIPHKRVRMPWANKPIPATNAAQYNLESLLREDGCLIVQDYARINPRDRRLLTFAKNKNDPSSKYSLFVKLSPGDEWTTLGHWDGGRCHKFSPSGEYLEMVDELITKGI